MKIQKQLVLLVLILLPLGFVDAAERVKTYQIEFDGGSAEKFWEQELRDLDLNVMLPDNAEKITLPKIRLHNASAAELFQALTLIGSQAAVKFAWTASSSHRPIILGLDGPVVANPDTRIWVLQSMGVEMTAQPFAIGHLLESDSNEDGYTVDEITSVIDSTVGARASVNGRESSMKFQYHEATELLIITGTENDVRVANMTLETLRQSQESKSMKRIFGGQGGIFGKALGDRKLAFNSSLQKVSTQ